MVLEYFVSHHPYPMLLYDCGITCVNNQISHLHNNLVAEKASSH